MSNTSWDQNDEQAWGITHTSKNIGVQNLEKKRRKDVFPWPDSSFSSTWTQNAQLQDIGNTISGKANAERRESNFKLQKISKEFLLKKNHNKVPPC
jgi:hypothetical protein